jgi:hypothetical protein
MDPEVNQAMVMVITQPEMKMKNIVTLPNQASHLLNHTQIPSFPIAYLLAFQ